MDCHASIKPFEARNDGVLVSITSIINSSLRATLYQRSNLCTYHRGAANMDCHTLIKPFEARNDVVCKEIAGQARNDGFFLKIVGDEITIHTDAEQASIRLVHLQVQPI